MTPQAWQDYQEWLKRNKLSHSKANWRRCVAEAIDTLVKEGKVIRLPDGGLVAVEKIN